MAATFIAKITDDKQRRIKIDKDAWDKEKLKKGDYVKVTIEKVNLEK